MKIMYLALDKRLYIKSESGGSTHILSVINEWKKAGHEVKLITSGTDSLPAKPTGAGTSKNFSLKSLLKKIIPNYIWLIFRDISDIIYSYKKVSEITAAISEFDPDLIYERNCYLCNAGYIAARKTSTPYFLEINAPVEERQKSFGAPLTFLQNIIEKKQFLFANGTIVVSSSLRDHYIRLGCPHDKIISIPNGVVPDRFYDCKIQGKEVRNNHNFDNKTTVVGFVGKVAKYHGFERLLNAAKIIGSQNHNIKLWIIGSSSNLDEYKENIKNTPLEKVIIFEGRVKKEDIPACLGAFDVAILPDNAWYGSPTKLFEYAAAGIPTIAPATPAVLDVFTDEDCILLNENDSLSEAIIKLSENPEFAHKLAKNMHRKVIENHTWKHVADNLIKFISAKSSQ